MNTKKNIEDIDIIFTSFCCGYGKMEEDVSIRQIMDGIKDYIHYTPKVIYKNIIINEPNLLLLDEPTALLDPDSQLDLVVTVRNLVKSRGITALWVTHRLEELNYCDGAFLLEKGCLVDTGEGQRLKQRLMQANHHSS